MNFLPFTQSQCVEALSERMGTAPAYLLELRTQAGPIYVCPSRWERTKLLWTFRNFRVLHAQVLTRSERRLIERLSRTAVIAPKETVFGSSVFGVVADSHPIPALSNRTNPTRESKPSESRAHAAGNLTISERRFLERCAPGYIAGEHRIATASLAAVSSSNSVNAVRTKRKSASREWISVAVLGAMCIAAILVRASGTPPSKAADSRISQTLLTRDMPAVVEKPPRSDSPADSFPDHVLRESEPLPRQTMTKLPIVSAPDRPVTSLDGSSEPSFPDEHHPEASELDSAAVTTSATADSGRLHIAELPQVGLTYPVAPLSNLNGKVNLRALIGVDGKIKEITVLSGNRTLADAAREAVRNWHYLPYKVQGHMVEAEAEIGFTFVGQEAVSITFASGAAGPASLDKPGYFR